ncbi:MAG: phosphatase PAP2 family protein [Anaerolineae bacterium]
MDQYLESLLPWGTGIIQAVQAGHTPFFDGLFKTVTFLGNVEGYLLLLPAIYWCIDARLGRRLGLVVFLSVILNFVAKSIYNLPRPDPALVRVLVEESSPSFPSGHAQTTLVMWGYLFTVWRKRVFGILAGLVILLVGVSRVYLGVHFPQDVLGGWLIGLVLLGVFLWGGARLGPVISAWPLWGQLVLAVVAPLGLFFILPVDDAVPAAAALLGFAVGVALEQDHLRFSADGVWRQRAIRYVAIVLVVAVWAGLRLVFPPGMFFRFVRYALTGVTAAYVAPLIFIWLGWAGRDQPVSTGR